MLAKYSGEANHNPKICRKYLFNGASLSPSSTRGGEMPTTTSETTTELEMAVEGAIDPSETHHGGVGNPAPRGTSGRNPELDAMLETAIDVEDDETVDSGTADPQSAETYPPDDLDVMQDDGAAAAGIDVDAASAKNVVPEVETASNPTFLLPSTIRGLPEIVATPTTLPL